MGGRWYWGLCELDFQFLFPWVLGYVQQSYLLSHPYLDCSSVDSEQYERYSAGPGHSSAALSRCWAPSLQKSPAAGQLELPVAGQLLPSAGGCWRPNQPPQGSHGWSWTWRTLNKSKTPFKANISHDKFVPVTTRGLLFYFTEHVLLSEKSY